MWTPGSDVLRMAVAEHMYLDKPAHAVVDSAVNLAQSVGAGSARGFTNAILRKITARSADSCSQPRPRMSGDAELAVRYSHPSGSSARSGTSWGLRNSRHCSSRTTCRRG